MPLLGFRFGFKGQDSLRKNLSIRSVMPKLIVMLLYSLFWHTCLIQEIPLFLDFNIHEPGSFAVIVNVKFKFSSV